MEQIHRPRVTCCQLRGRETPCTTGRSDAFVARIVLLAAAPSRLYRFVLSFWLNLDLTMRRVYLETSVISYLSAIPSRDLVVAGNQQVTRDWWQQRTRFEQAVERVTGF